MQGTVKDFNEVFITRRRGMGWGPLLRSEQCTITELEFLKMNLACIKSISYGSDICIDIFAQRNKETEQNNQPLISPILFQSESQKPG